MTIQNRYEFVYLFDVTNGNPNGDPDDPGETADIAADHPREQRSLGLL